MTQVEIMAASSPAARSPDLRRHRRPDDPPARPTQSLGSYSGRPAAACPPTTARPSPPPSSTSASAASTAPTSSSTSTSVAERRISDRLGRRRRRPAQPHDEGRPRAPGPPLHGRRAQPRRRARPRRRRDGRLPLRARRPGTRARPAHRRAHPHGLADHHRQRLPAGPARAARSTPTTSTSAGRPARARPPAHRLRLPRRGAGPPPPGRPAAVHRRLLRQHAPQRRRRPGGRRRLRPAARRGAGPLDRRPRRLPEQHGRPDHAAHDARASARRSPGATASTTAGRSSPSRSRSGSSRTTSATAGRRWTRSASASCPTSPRYELMKTRLLNASHCALGYLGSLAGYAQHRPGHGRRRCSPTTSRGSWTTRSTPLLPPPDGIDLGRLQAHACCSASPTRPSPTGCPGCAAAARRRCRTTCCRRCGRRSPRAARTGCSPSPSPAWFRYLRGMDADRPTASRSTTRRAELLQALARAGRRPIRARCSASRVDLRRPRRRPGFVAELGRALARRSTATASGRRSPTALTASVRAAPRDRHPAPTTGGAHPMPTDPSTLLGAGGASCSATPTATSSPPRSRPSTPRSRSPTPSWPRSAATAGSPPTSCGSPPPA